MGVALELRPQNGVDQKNTHRHNNQNIGKQAEKFGKFAPDTQLEVWILQPRPSAVEALDGGVDLVQVLTLGRIGLDGNLALAIETADEIEGLPLFDARHRRKGHLGTRSGVDLQLLQLIGVGDGRTRIAHYNIGLLVVSEYRTSLYAEEGAAHETADCLRIDSIACRLGRIDADAQFGVTALQIIADIEELRKLAQLFLDGVRGRNQLVIAIAKQPIDNRSIGRRAALFDAIAHRLRPGDVGAQGGASRQQSRPHCAYVPRYAR